MQRREMGAHPDQVLIFQRAVLKLVLGPVGSCSSTVKDEHQGSRLRAMVRA